MDGTDFDREGGPTDLYPETQRPEHVHHVGCSFGSPDCPAFGEKPISGRRPYMISTDPAATRGVIYGLLFSIPIWAVVITVIWWLR